MEMRTRIVVLLVMVILALILMMWNRESIHELQLAEAETQRRIESLEQTQGDQEDSLDDHLTILNSVLRSLEKLTNHVLPEKTL